MLKATRLDSDATEDQKAQHEAMEVDAEPEKSVPYYLQVEHLMADLSVFSFLGPLDAYHLLLARRKTTGDAKDFFSRHLEASTLEYKIETRSERPFDSISRSGNHLVLPIFYKHQKNTTTLQKNMAAMFSLMNSKRILFPAQHISPKSSDEVVKSLMAEDDSRKNALLLRAAIARDVPIEVLLPYMHHDNALALIRFIRSPDKLTEPQLINLIFFFFHHHDLSSAKRLLVYGFYRHDFQSFDVAYKDEASISDSALATTVFNLAQAEAKKICSSDVTKEQLAETSIAGQLGRCSTALLSRLFSIRILSRLAVQQQFTAHRFLAELFAHVVKPKLVSYLQQNRLAGVDTVGDDYKQVNSDALLTELTKLLYPASHLRTMRGNAQDALPPVFCEADSAALYTLAHYFLVGGYTHQFPLAKSIIVAVYGSRQHLVIEEFGEINQDDPNEQYAAVRYNTILTEEAMITDFCQDQYRDNHTMLIHTVVGLAWSPECFDLSSLPHSRKRAVTPQTFSTHFNLTTRTLDSLQVQAGIDIELLKAQASSLSTLPKPRPSWEQQRCGDASINYAAANRSALLWATGVTTRRQQPDSGTGDDATLRHQYR